ncbi:MAG TPA: thioredoxin domain-containing protein [Gemmatimonadaceae bacterium]|nr:thioredoxin domain-containing protein [Gemmatimonadaceae bacterium]
MPNRLASETSPYLLQHANNPVDWYAWGPEGLERAKTENKPILLSIGYAACHWCHVMEHESFEDETTAALMNEHFVNIKVDREERPDLDAIYMQAVQAMTGHGGWPMTVFLTPDGVPFYGGTYFPAEPRFGMPTFKRILTAVSDSYRNKPAEVARAAESVREMYDAAKEATRSGGTLGAELLDRAYRSLADDYDEEHGGFGGAPKFPATMALDFLLRYWARTRTERALSIATNSFLQMARGGIYDQVGGGFARYTVDAIWLVPHFEKMLYDNALLVRFGAHLWQATGDAETRRVVEETIDWAIREMRAPDGGFYSSYDADSEGHEGKFYVWDAAELDAALGNDAAIMRAYWGVRSGGNFEGRNILFVATRDTRALARRFSISLDELEEIVARSKRTLYERRKRRVWPGLDDKVLASWNGLMVRGIAEAARAFGNDEYRRVAIESGTFLFEQMVRDGRVLRSYKDGRARITGYLEDYASLALAALSLYELTFDAVWLARSRELGESIVRLFWDDDINAFFDTASDHEALVVRPRDVTDNAVPSGTSLAAELLARLAELYHDVDARRRATWIIETQFQTMQRYPSAFGHALGVADMLIHGAVELAIVGEPGAADFTRLERAAAERYVPSLVLAGGPPSTNNDIALLADREARDGHATAYVCRSYACEAPATSVELLVEQLERIAGAGSG